jgi:hypothetical protein
MLTSLQTELRRPVPLALAILAALGWLILIIYWLNASGGQRALEARVVELEAEREQIASQFAAHREANRSHAELVEAIEVAQTELAELEARRDLTDEEAAAREAELEELEAALDTAQGELAAARAALEEAESDSEAARQAAELRAEELAEVSDDLVRVGARLEESRALEAELLQRLSELSEQASEQSALLADSETRLQESREEAATLESSLSEARAEAAEMEQRQTALGESIDQQQEHRVALSGEIQQAEEQRQRLQGQVTELAQTLAERGQQIADTEARLENLQSEVSQVAASSVSGLQPGRYLGLARSVRSVRIEALFAEDGGFALTSSERDGSSVTGQYELANGEVIFNEAGGDLGTASFPMRCAIEQRGAGFSIPATAGDEGCVLAGVDFYPAD